MSVHQVPPGAEGWHEDDLILSVLKSGSKTTTDLWEAVHSLQTVKMSLMPSPPHVRSNFHCRIKSLCDRGFIIKTGTVVALTGLGQWVISSTLLDQSERTGFVDTWVCSKCSNLVHVVIQTPVLKTAKTTSNAIRMDATCPSCKETNKYIALPIGMNVDSFVSFYNNAIVKLAKYVKVTGTLV